MADWWDLAQVTAAAAGPAATYVGLRRMGRTVLWNLVLKAMDVDADQRRDIVLASARKDLKLDRGDRSRHDGPGEEPGSKAKKHATGPGPPVARPRPGER